MTSGQDESEQDSARPEADEAVAAGDDGVDDAADDAAAARTEAADETAEDHAGADGSPEPTDEVEVAQDEPTEEELSDDDLLISDEDADETVAGTPTFEPEALTQAISTAAIAIVGRRNRTERGIWITGVVLLLGAIGVLAYYLSEATDSAIRWEDRSAELSEINYDLGGNIADLQTEISNLESDNQVYADQNRELRERVLELSDEKQQALDTNAYSAQQAERLDGLVSQGVVASSALARCVQEQNNLAAILENPEDYDEEQIAEYADSVDELCVAALESYNQFQADVVG